MRMSGQSGGFGVGVIEAAGAEGEIGAGRRRAWMFARAICRDAGEKTTRAGSGGAPRGVFTAPVAPSVFPMVGWKKGREDGRSGARIVHGPGGDSPLHNVRGSARYILRFVHGSGDGGPRLGPTHARYAQLVANPPLHVQHAGARAGHRAAAHRERGDDGNRVGGGVHDVHRERRRVRRGASECRRVVRTVGGSMP